MAKKKKSNEFKVDVCKFLMKMLINEKKNVSSTASNYEKLMRHKAASEKKGS